ncbi:DUF2064 domain-containing protein [Hymenobacter sp. BT186]|uniref:DUF2064 domain-containing protein n=1 Tax=Hymenobacter telluris TaxID=2816474 RepID=A0A939ETM3_9BACT|nr:DUF2064 domain-containing protein [Hymenobacter telluris]MBO0357061.1 DUF2064 domain-containing protein [Hymenobacter telluris]MBW3373088.1 DUF2064 domain-containing protein [Hymenobacter norwichensis]
MTTAAPVAILLFTRSAAEEARHKRFVGHGPPGRNVSVAAQLIHHAQATAALAGVDVVCVDSSQQTGATFGERLADAMQQVFGLGYEQVLVIGNDCPQLAPHLLRQAVAAVRCGKTVLGPATDGGVYLLGISRRWFEQACWQALPWQTRHLGAALQQVCRQHKALVEFLPLLADVDNEQDLVRVLHQPLPRALRRRLRHICFAKPILRVSSSRRVRRLATTAQPHRGPPVTGTYC